MRVVRGKLEYIFDILIFLSCLIEFDMEESKRIRNVNWTEQEKKVLRMLVLERADIIEKKDATTNTNAAKKLAWEEVLFCFNAVSANNRNTTQLVNQWRNMKNKAKKSEFAYRKARTMTGGGPPPSSPPAEDRELIDAIPNEFTVDINVYDTDSIYAKQLKDSPKTHDSNAVLPDTSETKNPRPLVTLQANKNKKKNRKKNNLDCCLESHDHQIFVLAKTSREEAMRQEKDTHECKMQNERELHERRIELMSLEEDYWRAKIMILK